MIKQLASTLFGTLIIGIPLAALMMAAIIAIPAFTVDAAYSAALFIPGKLGLVPEVTADEIIEIEGGQDTLVTLARNGRYRIFADKLIAPNTIITLTSQPDGQIVEVTSLYEPGKALVAIDLDAPQYVFTVDKAGSYVVETSAIIGEPVPSEVRYIIKPYVGNRQATLAIFGGLAQIALLAFMISFVYRWINREKIEAEKVAKEESRGEWEAFFDEEKRRSGLD